MRKKFFHFLITITLIAFISALFYLYFFCYNLHLIKKSYEPLSNYDSTASYIFSISDIHLDSDSWNSPTSTLSVDITNKGTCATKRYDNVSLTFVNIRNDYPITIGVETDTRDWTNTATTSVDIPFNKNILGFGQYEIYFNVWDDSTASQITFDNNLELTKYGYYLGSISISHLIF